MRFREVQHQDRALSIIRRALRSGRTHHAYLFDGPDGVGKEMAGNALAARLLCEDTDAAPDADACGVCRACRLMAAGNHPDFHLIHRGLRKFHPDRSVRTSKGLFLVVDLIRLFLIEPAMKTPNLGRRHVFLIREAERMNEGAQNALLKTLEEPPGEACLILVTSSAERLLPTIRSRCQRVPFDLLPPAFVREHLTARLGLAPPLAQTLARLADGRLGVAVQWHQIRLLDCLDGVCTCLDRLDADDPEGFGRELVETATALARRTAQPTEPDDAPPSDDYDEENGSSGSSAKTVPTDELRDALKLVLMLVASLYRDALVTTHAPDADRSLPELRKRVDSLARSWSADTLEAGVHAVANAERMLDRNVAPQLVGERLAAALTGTAPVE